MVARDVVDVGDVGDRLGTTALGRLGLGADRAHGYEAAGAADKQTQTRRCAYSSPA